MPSREALTGALRMWILVIREPAMQAGVPR
jgi:hypothetical protein